MIQFRIGERLYDGSRPLVMGICNVTPDSFYDGGRYYDSGTAVEHVLNMADQGAGIIDIGGESSRPGSAPVPEEEERARVLPVVEQLAQRLPVPLSVDTRRAEVARRALDAGAAVINDISAMRDDPAMAGVVAEYGATVVLMHMQGTPETMQRHPDYVSVVDEVLEFLGERVDYAVGAGISRERILVDPGIGFGKTLEHNLALIRDIDRFHETGCAVLVGASRKSMFGMISGAAAGERHWGTAAVTAYCVMKGVEVHRVHDVGGMRQVIEVTTRLMASDEPVKAR